MSTKTTSPNNTSSPTPSEVKKTRFEKEIDFLTQQVIELDTREAKIKQLFPQDHISTEKNAEQQLLKHVDPTLKYFSTIGAVMGGLSCSYLLYNPLNNSLRRLFRSNYKMRYFVSIPVMTLLSCVSAGCLSGVYAYGTHRAIKFWNRNVNGRVDINDDFDDFVISGLPVTREDLHRHLEK